VCCWGTVDLAAPDRVRRDDRFGVVSNGNGLHAFYTDRALVFAYRSAGSAAKVARSSRSNV
jgi:hypothetical protein